VCSSLLYAVLLLVKKNGLHLLLLLLWTLYIALLIACAIPSCLVVTLEPLGSWMEAVSANAGGVAVIVRCHLIVWPVNSRSIRMS
jgi:hypothetical protein